MEDGELTMAAQLDAPALTTIRQELGLSAANNPIIIVSSKPVQHSQDRPPAGRCVRTRSSRGL